MDAITEFSDYVEGKMLPHITRQMRCIYTIYMVMITIQGKDYNWHKSNLLTSFVRSLVYAVGVEVILALLTGENPFVELTSIPVLLIVSISWWLFLFVPYDIFNKLIYLKVGEFQPFYLIVVWFSTAHRIVRIGQVVEKSLKVYDGSLAVIILGIVAGNGTVLVSPVFGDYAACLGDNMKYRIAVMTSVALTAFGLGYIPWFTHSVVLTLCLIVASLVELSAALDRELDLFQPFIDFVRTIVVTKELVKTKSS